MTKRQTIRTIFYALVLLALVSCTSDYNEFCTQYQVSFSCDITNVPYNAVSSMGQFITVRKKTVSSSCTVYNPSLGKTTEVPLSEVEIRSFSLGLGGLILGQPYFNDGKASVYAYDLACPVCDKASSRLSLDTQGNAKCPKCGNVYDLNNGGLVIEGEGRPLYRYHVTQSSVSTLFVHN